MKVDSTTHRAVALPGMAAAVTTRAAVSPQGPRGPALLEVDDGGPRVTTTIDVYPHDGVPDGVLVLPEDLHEDMRLGHGARWWLRERPVVDARSVLLEPATARAPDRASRDVVNGGLVGAVLTPSTEGFAPIVVGGSTYTVKDVCSDGRGALVRIGPRTTVELFAPGARTGVDMVILADVSWSMNVEDIPKPGGGHTKRIDVLRRSLRTLLAERTRAFGPASQVALLAFDAQARHRFPTAGGMAELDAASPKAVTNAFRGAVDELAPRRHSGTDLQRALQAAADLLLTHGRPANERVIVLVSDGADCPRGRQEDTGKVLGALEEPVSLMQHLHQNLRIRLHAVGIGTEEWFDQRGYEPDPALTPDHRLLKMLVDAGGGGRPTIGGVDDVGRFFGEMATGMRYPVRGKLSAMAPLRLDQALLRRLATRGRKQASAAELAEWRDQLRDSADAVHFRSTLLFGDALFHDTYAERLGSVLADDATETCEAAVFARNLHSALRRMRSMPERAADVKCVRRWKDTLDRLDRALAAERDLSELAQACGSASTGVPDIAMAVLRVLVKDLEHAQRELAKMSAPAARRSGQVVVAGPAMAAITQTAVPLKG